MMIPGQTIVMVEKAIEEFRTLQYHGPEIILLHPETYLWFKMDLLIIMGSPVSVPNMINSIEQYKGLEVHRDLDIEIGKVKII